MLFDLPNLLTLSRIVAIPLFCAAFWLPGAWSAWVPLAIFAGAGLTDWADGHLARRMGRMSELGRFLDPVADKLLVAAAIVMLVAEARIFGLSVLAAVVIMCREVLVAGLREFLAELRVKVPVTRLAKWKTTAQMIALGFLIVGPYGPGFLPVEVIGDTLLWVAALLTLYTGWDYLQSGLRHMMGPSPTGQP